MDITKIDKNFATCTLANGREVRYLECREAPLRLEGLPFRGKDGGFYRVNETISEANVNIGVIDLAHHTAGAAVRFVSDTPYLNILEELEYSAFMPHMTNTGSAGADIYVKLDGRWTFFDSLQPATKASQAEMWIDFNFQHGEKREFMINLPLYGGVKSMKLGFAPKAVIEAPPEHRIALPVGFYGSSITQGGCASRPGNCYSSMLCRELDAEQLNLGFSGSGKGESAMAKMLAGIPMSLFVYDYDHNAPNAEHLQNTHLPFFRTVREAQPDLPIIILSKCDIYWHKASYQADCARRDIVRKTYEWALEHGDEHVAFIDGENLFGSDEFRDACTVDGTHPNDLGFFRMFQNILPVARKMLETDSVK